MSKRPDIGEMEVWRELGTATEDVPVKVLRQAKLIDITKIKPNPQQPRKSFDDQALDELTESIREKGLLQPIVVRQSEDDFIIIAGHRRHLACQRAGMDYIPAIIREATEEEALEQSLIENVQREDIAPVEEATCYRQLMDEHSYSIRDMAAKVHKSVGYIHSRLKLLEHEDIAEKVQTQQIGIFEARELSKVEDEEARRELTEKTASGELDRKGLKQAVKVATGQAEPTPEEPGQPVEAVVEEPVGQPQPELTETVEAPVVEAEPPTEEIPEELDVTPQPESESGLPALYRRWEALKQDLVTLDIEKLPNEDRNEARRLLEAIRDTIEEILKE